MNLEPDIMKQWKQEFPINEAVEIAKKNLWNDEVEKRFLQFYDKCSASLADHLSEIEDEEDFDYFKTNKLKEYCLELLVFYKNALGRGHSPAFSFTYAYARSFFCGERESDALEEAYRSMGDEDTAQRECEQSGKSAFYAKIYIESVLGSDGGNLEKKAEQCEANYLKCIADGRSEVYAEQYSVEVYRRRLPVSAHDFAYCCELLVNAGMEKWEASSYTTEIMAEDPWIRGLLKVETRKLAKKNNLPIEIFEFYLINEYAKEVGFPNPELDDCEEQSKQQATDILSGKYSLDVVKKNALSTYRFETNGNPKPS